MFSKKMAKLLFVNNKNNNGKQIKTLGSSQHVKKSIVVKYIKNIGLCNDNNNHIIVIRQYSEITTERNEK